MSKNIEQDAAHPIMVWEYLTEYATERDDVLDAVEKVFRSGRLILGESVRNFEAAFAAFCDVAHGVGVDNATNGLFLALKALGIGPGDEVITVANTAVPTVSAIVSTGATPRFVDIDPETYLMDVNQLEASLTERTRCLLPVHLFGQCADMAPLLSTARRHGLRVLEDCSQAHGATYQGRKAGSMGDAGVFSFYPTKVLGAFGDGGIVVTTDDAIDAKLRRLRYYGMDQAYYAEEHGYNSRLDELQAEILLRKLGRIDAYIGRRQHLAARYHEILAGTSLTLPVARNGNEHVFYVYVCRHPERYRLLEEMKRHQVFLNVTYPYPIHTMRGYDGLGYKEGDLPTTERMSTQIFNLPMYPALEEWKQDAVCRAIGEVLGEQVSLG